MLYLASQSPRRRELLARLGLPFGLVDVDVPEQRIAGEPAVEYVRRVAREKAGAGLLAVVGNPAAVVIGADTEVILDDVVFGKPADAADAATMLRQLSGRTHAVVSAIAVLTPGRELQTVSTSQVSFDVLDEERIAAYVASGEPMGKAGAYAIQGYAESFILRLDGSYTGVMGLPLQPLAALLRELGLTPRPPESAA